MINRKIAWHSQVSPQFVARVCEICTELGVNPDYLMACMAFESGETFSPSIANAAGSGAVGLIQFMPGTAAALGTTTESLVAMDAVEQLEWVRRYFRPWRGRLKTLEDVYMAILWPRGVGKPDDYVLFAKNNQNYPRRYLQNAGLDFNSDGLITKKEAAAAVRKKLDKGLNAGTPPT